MILFIIFVALTIVGIVLTILGAREVFWCNEADIAEVGGIACDILMGSGLIISLIWIPITQSNYDKNNIRIKCEEQIASIQNTRLALENKIESNTLTILEVNTYNESVKEFKTKIKQEQLALQNPWINWYVSPVYSEFNPDVVSYLYID